ncbi:MAG: YncE family protein [Salibacteraceae bacterium]
MNIIKSIPVLQLFSICLFILSCEDNLDFGPQYVDQADTNVFIPDSLVLFLGNEGNFQYGNASLSTFDPVSKTIRNNVFKNVNNQPLGDVLQSIHHTGDTLFLIVNNSGEVLLINAYSYKLIGRISDLTSPRYCFSYGKQLVVTDLYGDKLTFINKQTLNADVELPVKGWTERIAEIGKGLCAIANIDQRMIHVVDLKTHSIIQSKQLELVPQWMWAVGDELVVAGNRKLNGENAAGIEVLNSSNLEKIRSVVIGRALRAACGDEDFIYLVSSKRVFRYDLNLSVIDSADHQLQTPYSISINPANGHVFITDVQNYLSNGFLVEYDAHLNLLGKYQAGAIPQAMLWLYL